MPVLDPRCAPWVPRSGILLNEKGERFANELGRRDYLSNAIFAQNERNRNRKPEEPIAPTVAYMVLNAAAAHKFGQATFDFYFRTRAHQLLQEEARFGLINPRPLYSSAENSRDQEVWPRGTGRDGAR